MAIAGTAPGYVELQVTSNFSFLHGASHPEELAMTAAALGHPAIAIADRNSLAGVVRAHLACKAAGIRLVVGARLDLEDGPSLLCFPTDRAAYGRLAKLITRGRRAAAKGACRLTRADVDQAAEGQRLVVVPPVTPSDGFAADLADYRARFGTRLSLAAHYLYRGGDGKRLARLARLAAITGVPLVATNDVLMHSPDRRKLQDVLTCIREHCTIRNAGWRLHANAERHLKAAAEMARLFRDHPEAIARTTGIAEACRFSLDELRYEYPDEVTGEAADPQAELERLTWLGAGERYPEGLDDKVKAQLEHELGLIGQLGYAPYFLTVHDIVRFARGRGILCQGRGSAANSAVCYVLGITAVDPARADLLFERFVSPERNEPPDIDVDFEHERREEVIQYIYTKYGRERAGLTATVICYRARGAIRDVGKAMGLSVDLVDRLARTVWGWGREGVNDDRVREAGFDPEEPAMALALELSRQIVGFPRHLSQHVGGFVISRGPLSELVPIENAAMADRTVIQWDKDDLDALGILKVDVLALGMLSCIRRGFDLLAQHYDRPLTLANVPAEDPAVYDMLCKADSLGVFQVESRAQMTMLPRLKPRAFYDLVIEVAIVRPGPIQGDMVHPYLRRRDGREAVAYPSEELRRVLEKTLGVPLFQEQAMKIAIVAAGFTPAEADLLRRAMATFKKNGDIHKFRDKLAGGMIARGYDPDFAERCFKQIEGFGTYGFPESHAASFALLVYVSSWLKCHYPDVFACALLNSQPMGFYAPAQIVRDAREHGVAVREPDVNASDWDCTLEDGEGAGRALRLGLRQIKGLGQGEAERLVAARRAGGPFADPRSLWRRAGLAPATLSVLADADAFRSVGLDRRQAAW
ncbi:MAG: DNA polymerase III subunit alpha, partial [Alphaproteobacteria bacterium]|nr:DNA polymerase III subunit alpha [Alphaproteobacteria bacterium]